MKQETKNKKGELMDIQVLIKRLQKSHNKYSKLDILNSLDTEVLCQFLQEYKEFCYSINIAPWEIIHKLKPEQQKEFIVNLENLNLTLNEKKEILAVLKEQVKREIDTTNFSQEYRTALGIPTSVYTGRAILNFTRNLEDYRDLDALMRINPERFNEEERKKFLHLCDICPNMQVVNELNYGAKQFSSTPEEYKEGEEWINAIINSLDSSYSKLQKMALIDYAIGKKISYTPDYETEVFNQDNCRALWKVITSEYGVCNGIAGLEQYILQRDGIESQIVESPTHAFLRVKNIEIPDENGKLQTGDTLIDPTWNLTSHRFGAKPDNFCISYEQARKLDIDENGKDSNAHKNDEQLRNIILNLSEQNLRTLFTSVGLADKDGQFPIKDLIEKSKMLHEFYANNPETNIKKQLLLLSETCPEFATCQNSTMRVLKDILLSQEYLKFEKCVIHRVYNKIDEEKGPVLYVYIDSNELGKKFYFADKMTGQFIELPQEEFIKQFECYEEDLERANGFRPWESELQEKQDVDLSTSSGALEKSEKGEAR